MVAAAMKLLEEPNFQSTRIMKPFSFIYFFKMSLFLPFNAQSFDGMKVFHDANNFPTKKNHNNSFGLACALISPNNEYFDAKDEFPCI